jgi:hypothetical protein
MATSGDAALGHALHSALITKDWTRLRALLHDDCEWTLPGDNHISGTVKGGDEVLGHFQLIAGYGVSFTLLHVLVSRENMALNIRNQAQRGELTLDEHLATVCIMDGSLVRRIETYLSDVDAMNAFFTDPPSAKAS